MKTTLLSRICFITAILFAFIATNFAQSPIPRVMREIIVGERLWACTFDDKVGVSLYSQKTTRNYQHFDATRAQVGQVSARTPEEVQQWQSLFKKFLEWEKLAHDNNVESFYKVIGKIGSQEIRFRYDPDDTFMGDYIRAKDIPMWNKLLEQLPNMLSELEQKKKDAAKTEELFK